jgi:hypothetical protein
MLASLRGLAKCVRCSRGIFEPYDLSLKPGSDENCYNTVHFTRPFRFESKFEYSHLKDGFVCPLCTRSLMNFTTTHPLAVPFKISKVFKCPAGLLCPNNDTWFDFKELGAHIFECPMLEKKCNIGPCAGASFTEATSAHWATKHKPIKVEEEVVSQAKRPKIESAE